MCLQSSRKEPGRSGIWTEMRVSDVSARSEMKRKRSKSMLAPLATATKVLPVTPCIWLYFLRPATARAPAGSSTTLVSIKESLMAPQISSVETLTISSTVAWHSRKVSSPTRRTAAPSAKRPTVGSSTTSPASRLAVIAAESRASTPMTLIEGFTDFKKAPTPASKPPPPTQQNTASTLSFVVWEMISCPIVPWPAMTRGSSKGCTRTRPSASMHAFVAACASSYVSPLRMTSDLSFTRPCTASTLICGVVLGMKIFAEMPVAAAEKATPCAWFPAEQAQMPLSISSAFRLAILL
mmetsp:Transcript_130262/g.405188  ORF Transcript_130262/g.405188 Transcript_130262/m.405188 type:complete len:295 (+) Transcript_130262:669-1553(+)